MCRCVFDDRELKFNGREATTDWGKVLEGTPRRVFWKKQNLRKCGFWRGVTLEKVKKVSSREGAPLQKVKYCVAYRKISNKTPGRRRGEGNNT